MRTAFHPRNADVTEGNCYCSTKRAICKWGWGRTAGVQGVEEQAPERSVHRAARVPGITAPHLCFGIWSTRSYLRAGYLLPRSKSPGQVLHAQARREGAALSRSSQPEPPLSLLAEVLGDEAMSDGDFLQLWQPWPHQNTQLCFPIHHCSGVFWAFPFQHPQVKHCVFPTVRELLGLAKGHWFCSALLWSFYCVGFPIPPTQSPESNFLLVLITWSTVKVDVFLHFAGYFLRKRQNRGQQGSWGLSAALGSQQPWRIHKEKVFKQTQSRQNKTLEIEVFKMENLCSERTPQKCLVLGTHFKNAFLASGDDTAGLCEHEDQALNTKTQACQHAPIIPALGARDRQVLRACWASGLIKTGKLSPSGKRTYHKAIMRRMTESGTRGTWGNLRNGQKGAAKLAQRLRALLALLPEDTGSFPPPMWQLTTVSNTCSKRSNALFWPVWALHAQATQAYAGKTFKHIK